MVARCWAHDDHINHQITKKQPSQNITRAGSKTKTSPF